MQVECLAKLWSHSVLHLQWTRIEVQELNNSFFSDHLGILHDCSYAIVLEKDNNKELPNHR
jgi:uncharacterized membrane protein YcfT